MVKFFLSEYNATLGAYNRLTADSFDSLPFFKQYHTTYLFLYHFLFIVDVGIAVVGYSVASRWLDNRTKSVDMTVGGWMVALMCYPPMNSGFSDKFIGYGHISTHNIIYAEWAYMMLMALILFLFTIYVWATVALGFKFSNLTNRGIVDRGPYAFIRHPAYATKNLAWWLDNTFVLSNFWASLALFLWNWVYILRALTEERHLKKDPAYLKYMKKVKYRFIPKIV
jgi:protein-S-isoprenylcysteine O-methyltransferase Ste14